MEGNILKKIVYMFILDKSYRKSSMVVLYVGVWKMSFYTLIVPS